MNKIYLKYTVVLVALFNFVALSLAQNSKEGLGWITPGTQLSYYAMVATINSNDLLTLDNTTSGSDNGNQEVWQDAEGNTYTVENSNAAHAYSLVTVSHIDGDKAALSIKTYQINTLFNQIISPEVEGMVVQKSKVDDYWVSPRILENLPDKATKDLFVKRINYSLAGHTYSAIIVATASSSGYVKYTYDLASGVVLHTSQFTRSSKYLLTKPDSNGLSTYKQGDGQLIESWFKGSRKIGMPWAGQLPPEWVRSTHELDYQGTQYVVMSGLPGAGIPASAQVNFTNHANGWSNVSIVNQLRTGYGMPAKQEQTTRVVGTSEYGSYWIPVDYLKSLTQNQVLDNDILTKNKIYVLGVQNGQVGIAEVGSGFENHWYYSMSDGVLTGYEIIIRLGNSITNLHLELSNRR